MEDATVVNIVGLDKAALLHRLWSGAAPASYFARMGIEPPSFPDTQEVAEAVTSYIDYFAGRAIKADLSKDFVDPWLYDRDAGKGAFARAVAHARENQ